MSCILGIDESQPDFPDLGLTCCYGVAAAGPHACTCWRPVYDHTEQTNPDETAQSTVRPRMCGDCAYRPGSPEKTGDPQHRGDATELEILAESGSPFYCHDGMRRIVRWCHPSGAELPGHPADYAPPMVGATPYRTDGKPGLLCAGWDARRRALTAKEQP